MGDPTDIIGVFIPIIAVAGGIAIALTAMKHRSQQVELEHQERMLAIEKGTALPPPAMPSVRHRNPYVWGFILIAIGLAMMIGMGLEGDNDWGWGAMFLLPGIAILLAHKFYARERERKEMNGPPALPPASKLG